MMKKVVLGKTGIEAARLGLGTIPIQRVSERQAVETVIHAVERGVDFIDTSRAYTTSERRIGIALKECGRRVTLATKSLEQGADAIRGDIDVSLRELGREKIELYQCHFVKDLEAYRRVTSGGGALEGLLKAREEGLIGHLGITSHSLDVLARAVEDGLFETIMTCFSFLEPKASETVIPGALARGIGVIAMKPFSGGAIADARRRSSTPCPSRARWSYPAWRTGRSSTRTGRFLWAIGHSIARSDDGSRRSGPRSTSSSAAAATTASPARRKSRSST